MKSYSFSQPQKQSGAALIVGLILLMVMTLISLSALKDTTRQQLMVTNSEVELQTFAAAESAIRDVYNEVRHLRAPPEGSPYILQESIINSEAETPAPARQVANVPEMTINSSLSYGGTAPAPGSTINLGTGRGFVMHLFSIDGQAVMGEADDPLSQSWHRQGLAQIGPN